MPQVAHTPVNGGRMTSYCQYDVLDIVDNEVDRGVFQSWLDEENLARMIISPDLMVQWMSNRTKRFVEEGGIPVSYGHLIPPTSSVAKFLFLADFNISTCATYLDRQQKRWVVWARKLTSGTSCLTGLIFHPPSQWLCFSALSQAHALTPMEGKVIEMILNGHDTGRIAQQIGISKQTLKTHLKHAYSKLGVTSRGDLFSHAASFARPTGQGDFITTDRDA